MMKNSEGPVWKRNKINQKSSVSETEQMRDINTTSKKKKTTATKKKKISGENKAIKTELYPLCSYHQLPDYMKDNEYILNYYRSEWPVKQALYSLFRWHNETLNVWTHLLGFLLFVGLTVANLVPVPQMADFITLITEQFPPSAESNISDNFSMGVTKLLDLKQESTLQIPISMSSDQMNWPFYVFLFGSMFCLLSSTLCHLFSCHSRHLNLHLLHLDYVGISVMIITSFFPAIYYIFQCTPIWQIVYLGGITLLGICTIVALISPALSASKYRSIRASLFVAMGMFGLFPAIHALAANWNDPHRNATLAYEGTMAAAYLVGTGFYVGRIPERWLPGRLDLAGHSHQIFHVFVVIGALAHYCAAQIFLRYRSRMVCDAIA